MIVDHACTDAAGAGTLGRRVETVIFTNDICSPANTCAIVTRPEGEWIDEGYVDDYRGWYDVSGCGTCNDYCRWVGDDGSGGAPSSRLSHGGSWWSCRLAGTNDLYTGRERFK